MEIRAATRDEHGALGRLMVAVYSTLDGFPGPAEQPAYYTMLADVGRLAEQPGIELVVAVDGGRVIGGVVYVGDLASYGASGAVAHERDASGFRLLAVDPAARGTGAGRALVDACLARARARGHRAVVIHTTRAMRTAWGMYERLGFRRAPELDFVQGGALEVFGFRLALQ
jgi:ribosomal protein S18 acetylase RimI-like enzyme